MDSPGRDSLDEGSGVFFQGSPVGSYSSVGMSSVGMSSVGVSSVSSVGVSSVSSVGTLYGRSHSEG